MLKKTEQCFDIVESCSSLIDPNMKVGANRNCFSPSSNSMCSAVKSRVKILALSEVMKLFLNTDSCKKFAAE